MNLDFTNKSAPEQIKAIASYRGFNITQLSKEFNSRFGTKYTPDYFARKLRNNSISYDEMKKLGDILGFDVDIKLRD